MLKPDICSHVRDKTVLMIYREKFSQHFNPKLASNAQYHLREIAKVKCGRGSR